MRLVSVIMILAAAATAGSQRAGGSDGVSIVHPSVLLRDIEGVDVLSSRRPVSPVQTCGTCHDTEFIVAHSYHAYMGLDEMSNPGTGPGWRAWETSPGLFGDWDPLFYRYLTPPGDDLLDMGAADWIRSFGRLHAGGGPAVVDRTGVQLTDLKVGDAGAISFDEDTGARSVWNWRQSGVAEFNCFMCHLASPDNEARVIALREGRFEWSATATLRGTGLVARENSTWEWIDEAFDEDGLPSPERLRIMPPSSNHCGQCHGLVHMDERPVIPEYGGISTLSTETKGQIFSPQLLSRSGMNLEGKEHLGAPWDVHAEWLLECSDCHFALNNPAFTTKWSGSGRDLYFDGRRLGIDEFLTTPDHNFAKGRSAQGTIADNLDGTMRRCEDCHSVERSHQWLPYKRRHMDRLLCEVCHVPEVRAPARRVTDWTVLTKTGGPRVEYRGVRGGVFDPAAIVSGYRPVLLPREGRDGAPTRLAPHNLITSWFWIHGDPPRPVRLYDLKRAFFEGGSYHPDVVSALDTDGDGGISEPELLLDTRCKVTTIRQRLKSLGLSEPRVIAEIQPYSLHHGVVTGKWATRECTRCHSKTSDMSRDFILAGTIPGGVAATPVEGTNALMMGEIKIEGGRLLYTPVTMEDGFYILGHDRWDTIDTVGAMVVLGAFAAVIVHGGIRLAISRSRRSKS